MELYRELECSDSDPLHRSVCPSVCMSVCCEINICVAICCHKFGLYIRKFQFDFYFTIIHSVWYLQVSLAEQFPGDVLVTYNAPSVLVCTTLGIIVHSGN